MKFLIILFLSLAVAAPALSQQGLFRAFIKDSEDFEPMSNVQIKDTKTDKIVQSDASGYVEINTQVGHTLELSRLGVKTQNIVIKQPMFLAIQQLVLRHNVRELAEVVVADKTQYQIDSIERSERYKIPLSHKKDKANVIITPIGIGIENPISSWMQYVAPKTKQKLRFQKNFKNWEEQKYIDQKYDADVVAKITGLRNDSLAWFKNAFPMPYEMARQSSKDEIAYWIRANYDDWKLDSQAIIRRMEIED